MIAKITKDTNSEIEITIKEISMDMFLVLTRMFDAIFNVAKMESPGERTPIGMTMIVTFKKSNSHGEYPSAGHLLGAAQAAYYLVYKTRDGYSEY